ncbi:Uncharacterized protein YhaN [Oceanobacillus limi]|uniref:Uncharacterized protein YhaN n=1 Tax=Oceanobacillus limi TaxID=930131 RepID=A0A1H9YKH4_9BACI|nr:AAA family ATPase [Oceanobacillus limi]SES69470.1 Uncharacterized protein YhaN [Oceanobacillus limi]
MKILHGRIDGFAKWVDYDFDLSKQNFMVLYGENEAGKSSLYQFILFMLFGLPPKKRAYYRPKTSSKMGGRLTVSDPQYGEFTIERMDENRNGAAVCFTNDGEEHGEDWLQERLGGMSREAYHGIFSFSSQDLATIQTMKAEDMGEVLLGIGLSGATHIHSIEKQLDSQLTGLFKPYGKKPAINQQIRSLESQQRTLKQLKEDEATYRQKKTRQQELNGLIEDLLQRMKKSKESVIHLEKKRQAIPSVYEYHKYVTQLSTLSEHISFPEDGIERHHALKEKIIPLQSEMSILKLNEDKHREQLQKLEESLNAKQYVVEASDILRDFDTYKEINNERNRLKVEINRKEDQIVSSLAELNLELSPTEIEELKLPFHLEKIWNELKQEQQKLMLEDEQIHEEKQLLLNKQSFIETEYHDLEKQLLDREYEQSLRKKINDYKEHQLLERLQQEDQKKLENWTKTKQRTKRRTITLLLGSLFFTGIVAVMGILMDSFIFLNLAVLLALFGVGQWVLGKQSIVKLEKFVLETNRISSNEDLTESEIGEANRLLSMDEEIRKECSALKEQLKSIDLQFIQLDEKQTVKSEKEKRLSEKIQEQKRHYPFLQQMDVSYWSDIFHAVKKLVALHQEKGTLEKSYQIASSRADQYATKVKDFLQTINVSQFPSSVEMQVQIIQEELDRVHEMERSLKHVKKSLEENIDQQENIQKKIAAYNNEMNALYKTAKVSSEEAYYKQGNQLKQKEELEAACEKIVSQYTSIFSSEEWELMVDEKPTQSQIEAEIEQTEETVSEMENQLQAWRQDLADLNTDLKKMESSEGYSKIVHQYENEKEHLKEMAREWAVYKVAKELLMDTKRSYRNTYLSKIIEQTAFYFEKITDGNYTNVYPPTDEKLFLVENKDKIRYTVNELSQGTMDQLYVSLRLAIGEIMSQKNHLPFVMDDAFVHFDSIRTERVMEILAIIAETRQVILFSCKKEIRESTFPNLILL